MALWVNKVGPYNNPQETYNYYSLPFCRRARDQPTPVLDEAAPNAQPPLPPCLVRSRRPRKQLRRKWAGLGEALQGNELIDSGMEITFLSE